jgi:hypothetical protein
MMVPTFDSGCVVGEYTSPGGGARFSRRRLESSGRSRASIAARFRAAYVRRARLSCPKGCSGVAASECDYYDVLGVPESATTEEVRAAYRRAARDSHPDVNPGDVSAARRFVAVQRAYEVLSDPSRRAAYQRPASSSRPGRTTRATPHRDDGSVLPREIHDTIIAVRVIARMARPRVARRFRQLIRYLERL